MPDPSDRQNPAHGWWRLSLYGLPALPLAMLVGPVYVFLPNYLTETVGLSAAAVGLAFSFTRLWDVVTDPIGGLISDRFATRAIWMFAGLPLMLLGIYFIFIGTDALSIPTLALASVALYTGWTVTKLNHDAWGAEVTHDYDGRTRYAGVREGFGLLGGLLIIIALGSADRLGPQAVSRTLTIVGWMLIAGLPLLFALAVWRVPAGDRRPSKMTWLDFTAIWQDPALRRLSIAFLLNGVSAALPASLFLDFVQYRLGAPDLAGPLLIVYFLSGVVAIPFWLWLSRRLDKPRAWIASMAWSTVFFLIVPFLSTGDAIWFTAICVVTGISLGADLALPASIQADIVDHREAQTGRQQTGILFALLGMLTKLAYAVGILAYPVLSLAGFETGEGQQPSDQSLVLLGLLYGALPCAAKVLAIWTMWDFPLSRAARAIGPGSI